MNDIQLFTELQQIQLTKASNGIILEINQKM